MPLPGDLAGGRMIPQWPDIVQLNLRWGRDGARTIGDLAESLQTSRRIVEKAIESLRLEGVPVVTCSAGCYLTTDALELRAAYRALRRRYIHQAVGARVLLRTAERYERAAARLVQESIWP